MHKPSVEVTVCFIHRCVPGLQSLPDKSQLSLYLEFIEHHLQLGVSHIFIVTALSWYSPHMTLLLRILEVYIEQGFVSVQSSSFDGYDLVDSFGGLQLHRDNLKIFYVNMCTYFNKGSFSVS